jgi:hypothetical protein
VPTSHGAAAGSVVHCEPGAVNPVPLELANSHRRTSKIIFATLLTRDYPRVHASKTVCRQACNRPMVESSARERIRLRHQDIERAENCALQTKKFDTDPLSLHVFSIP